MSQARVETVTIIDGSSTPTNGVNMQAGTPIGVITPAAWTAAALTFLVSMDGTTYVPLYDDTGTEVSIPSASIATAASRAFNLDPTKFLPWNWIKLQSGVNGAAVNQVGANRTLQLLVRNI